MSIKGEEGGWEGNDHKNCHFSHDKQISFSKRKFDPFSLVLEV